MKTIFLLITLSLTVLASNISKIEVPGMHCPLCTLAVKKAIKKLNGVESVSVKLNTKTATVIYNDNLNIDEILKAIKTTSYEGVELSTKEYRAK